MEIFKTDYLKKQFKKFQKEDLVAVLSYGYCQKKLVVNGSIANFLLAANIARKVLVKTAINLKQIQKHFYWGLIQLVEITYKTL